MNVDKTIPQAASTAPIIFTRIAGSIAFKNIWDTEPMSRIRGRLTERGTAPTGSIMR